MNHSQYGTCRSGDFRSGAKTPPSERKAHSPEHRQQHEDGQNATDRATADDEEKADDANNHPELRACPDQRPMRKPPLQRVG